MQGSKRRRRVAPRDINEALAALSHLLAADLQQCTRNLENAVEEALKSNPSHWELLLGVKNWAVALAGVCRSYAAKCARIHSDASKQSPPDAAMGTLLVALCDHLLQSDSEPNPPCERD